MSLLKAEFSLQLEAEGQARTPEREESSVLHWWLEYVGSFVERTREVTLGGSDSC